MRKYSIIFTLVFLLISTAFINYNLSKIKYVKAACLKTINYSPILNVAGEFEYADKTDIIMSFPLCVKDVYVKENSYVNKGQALFSIDKAKMASIVSDGPSEELLSVLDTSEISSLKNRLESFSSEDTINLPDVVYSPENGIVSSVNIFSGGFAMPDRVIMSIGNTDEMLAKFSLSQLDYGKINIGDSVDIKPVAFSNKKYSGTISDNNAVVKKQNSLSGNKTVIEVFATIDNADYLVSDGLRINGTVHCGPVQRINTLDYNFIFQDGKEQFVFVLQDGKAVKKNIDTGIETDEYTQILTDLHENTVFITGEINEGDKVIVTE